MLVQPSAPPAPEPPVYAPPSTGPYRLHRERSASETLMAIVGAIMGLLIFAGFLSFHAIFLIPMPCTGTYGPTPTPGTEGYAAVVQALAWAAGVALDLVAGLSVALAFIFCVRTDVPESTRRSLCLFAKVFVAVWVVLGVFFFSSVASIVRYL